MLRVALLVDGWNILKSADQTWTCCHGVDVIALCSGDGGYAEVIRRAKALGLRVEVYLTPR